MRRKIILGTLVLTLTGCTYNPFTPGSNDTTGSGTATLIGAGVGAGSMALIGGRTPAITLAGLAGGAIGYYATTLRFASGGVLRGGGQVYKIGEVVGIYMPTDYIFEPNNTEFTPEAGSILDSAIAVLERYNDNNVIISGNTSGFGRERRELRLSEQRAAKVAAYLWNAGIINFREESTDIRKLQYVGYGDFFPIATTHRNEGLRENSRIQIISYPNDCDLGIDKRHVAVHNVGALDNDKDIERAPPTPNICASGDGSCMESMDHDEAH